jgi:hypothetical protein
MTWTRFSARTPANGTATLLEEKMDVLLDAKWTL